MKLLTVTIAAAALLAGGLEASAHLGFNELIGSHPPSVKQLTFGASAGG
jgi:hypothetical protein